MKTRLSYAFMAVFMLSAVLAADGYAFYLPQGFLDGSSAYLDDSRSIFYNPAALGSKAGAELYYDYRLIEQKDEDWSAKQHTFGLALGAFGIGYQAINPDSKSPLSSLGLEESELLSVGFGAKISRYLRSGTNLKWYDSKNFTDSDAFGMDFGLIIRPYRSLSVGILWENMVKPRFHMEDEEIVFDERYHLGLGFRPLGERITFTADAIYYPANAKDDADDFFANDDDKYKYRYGLEAEVLPGLIACFNMDSDNNYLASIKIRFDEFGILGGYQVDSIKGTEDDMEMTTQRYGLTLSSYKAHSILGGGDEFVDLAISGNLVDERGGFAIFGSKGTSVQEILRGLRRAERDDEIAGVLLTIRGLNTGIVGNISAMLQELREGINRFRKTGKVVVAYLEEGGTASELYLASAADAVIMPPTAMIMGLSVAVEIKRYRETLKKVGIDFELQTAGKYKDSFFGIADPASEEQAAAIQSMVEDIYDQMIDQISAGRGIARDDVLPLAQGQIIYPQEALKAKLIDEIGYKQVAKKRLAKLCGFKCEDAKDLEELKGISLSKARTYPRWGENPRIAIIEAYGGIVTGESREEILFGGRILGSDTVAAQLRKARTEDSIKAVVFRIDSGGGSGIASDIILEEVKKYKEAGKPIVVSMGDVAGSGGYWIASHADYIYANAATLTGSIGVVAAKPVLQRLFEKIGVTNEVYKKGEYADFMSLSRPYTDQEREQMEALLENFYDRFIKIVAQGRNLSVERVREIAEGRIYTGRQAAQIGLIDATGTLRDAVDKAKELAGIKGEAELLYVRGVDFEWLDLFSEGVTLFELPSLLMEPIALEMIY